MVFLSLPKRVYKVKRQLATYCTDVFIWHQAIHSTYKMTPTYVRYMLQVFFGLFFSFLYKIPRYIMQGITSRVC